MKPNYRGWCLVCFVFLLGISNLYAQNNPNRSDTVSSKRLKIPITGGEKYDIIFTRTFLIPLNVDTTAIFDASRSGSYTMGMGLSFAFGSKIFALKFEPRLNWNKLFFKSLPQKSFPTTGDNLYTWEKHRFFYLALPIAAKFNILRNEEDKVTFFVETGGFVGYGAASMYKRRYQLKEGESTYNATEKFSKVANFNRFRGGAYVRIGTRWVALDIQYRISPIYMKSRKYLHPNTGMEVAYPTFSPLEIGLVAVF